MDGNPFVQAGIDAGLDPTLASYMPTYVNIESGGNPNAQTGSYSGLLQQGPDEIAKYGSGLAGGARMYAARQNWFKDRFGRLPSPTELYLANQQGEGGLSAHLGNPNAPAWMNMFSTAEGQKKGQGWAQKAIWGNIPDALKAQYGNVNNVSSQDFVNLWQHRVEGTPFQRGNAPMADYNQQQPALNLAQQQQPPVLFGGNPTPVGAFGALGRMLGIGTENELGRRLQNAGAGLIAVSNPAGGAALQAAANMPHYDIVTDAYGNRYMVDKRTGNIVQPGTGGGVSPGFNNQVRPQGQQQQQSEQALSNLDGLRGPKDVIAAHEASQKQLDKLQEAASQAAAFADQNQQLMRYSQGNDIVQGPGLWNMIKDKAAELSNGAIGGVNIANQHAFSQGVSQLTGARLKLMGVTRIAQPEITFGAQGNASEESPAATNQQVFSNNIQDAKRVMDIRDIALKHYARDGVLGPAYMAEVKKYIADHPVHQDTSITPGSQQQSGFKILKVHPTE